MQEQKSQTIQLDDGCSFLANFLKKIEKKNKNKRKILKFVIIFTCRSEYVYG